MKRLPKTKAVVVKSEPSELELISQNKIELAKFLEKPFPTIAEAVTGALSLGASGMAVAGMRIVQGALKGNFATQVSREIKALIKAGRIPEDYANEKFGFQSFAELLKFIDEEEVDQDRLLAVKAMFFALNKVGRNAGEDILNYELFKLSKKLEASQLLMLAVSYRIYKTRGNYPASGRPTWIKNMASDMGHGMESLVERDEEILEGYRLLSKRYGGDGSLIIARDGRLTDLGLKLCEKIEDYKEAINHL
jgi:hypothetical protein